LEVQTEQGRTGRSAQQTKDVAVRRLYRKNDKYMEKRPTPEHRLVADKALSQEGQRNLPLVGW
jgi:hypothetical protein